MRRFAVADGCDVEVGTRSSLISPIVIGCLVFELERHTVSGLYRRTSLCVDGVNFTVRPALWETRSSVNSHIFVLHRPTRVLKSHDFTRSH